MNLNPRRQVAREENTNTPRSPPSKSLQANKPSANTYSSSTSPNASVKSSSASSLARRSQGGATPNILQGSTAPSPSQTMSENNGQGMSSPSSPSPSSFSSSSFSSSLSPSLSSPVPPPTTLNSARSGLCRKGGEVLLESARIYEEAHKRNSDGSSLSFDASEFARICNVAAQTGSYEVVLEWSRVAKQIGFRAADYYQGYVFLNLLGLFWFS